MGSEKAQDARGESAGASDFVLGRKVREGRESEVQVRGALGLELLHGRDDDEPNTPGGASGRRRDRSCSQPDSAPKTGEKLT